MGHYKLNDMQGILILVNLVSFPKRNTYNRITQASGLVPHTAPTGLAMEISVLCYS